jgi:glycosyltransferase involved in cell wall biosynthesis
MLHGFWKEYNLRTIEISNFLFYINIKLTSRVLIITNIPSPYRVLQFDRLSQILKEELCVIYYQETEFNRNWGKPELRHNSIFLKHSIFSGIKFHPDIFRYLIKVNPQIVIASGFTSTIILTFLYSKLTKKKFVVFTDSWIHPVNKLRIYHRYFRRIIIPRADATICIGKRGKEYLLAYGAKEISTFISPLAINNEHYFNFYQTFEQKEFDLIFSGQLIDRKMPLFITDVLRKLKVLKSNISILIVGSGPMDKEMMQRLDEYEISYSFPGFIQQEELPKYYANSKILLFPTKDDPWGIVANEACAVGTPVITCNNAGAANDLVIHGYNGFVLPLSIDVWVQHILRLLTENILYNTLSKNSLIKIREFSVDNAATGIKNAIDYLLTNERD